MQRGAYTELIGMTTSLISDPLFDPDHAEWVDKPYYRCQIGGVACQTFVSYINTTDSSDLERWLVRILSSLKTMTQLREIDPHRPGYFFGNHEASSAQNYNLAITLDAAVRWFRG